MPPPTVLRQYDDVIPGSAERIMRMMEEQASHRIQAENRRIQIEADRVQVEADLVQVERDRVQVEKTAVVGESKRAYLGIACAFIFSLLLIALGAYAIIGGSNPWVGVSVIGTGVAGLAGVFVHGTNSRRRDRERKAADADAGLD